MDKPIIVSIDISELKNMCQEYIDLVDKGEYIDDDFQHYIFECALETFFGKDVWKFINSKP
jgi:hypothetical protein